MRITEFGLAAGLGVIAWATALCDDCQRAEAQTAVSCTPAVIAENDARARIVFEEILTRGRIEENEHIYHPAFRAHGLTRDASRAEDRAASEGWRRAVPDIEMRVLRSVSDCTMSAVHWEGTGTNTGEGNGLPATGRRLQAEGVTFFGMRDGRIYEEWTVFDRATMMEQLGLAGAQ